MSLWRRRVRIEALPADDELVALRREGYTVVEDVERDVRLASGPNGVFLIELRLDATMADVSRKATEVQRELRCAVTPVLCSGSRTFLENGVIVAARGALVEAIRKGPRKRPLAPAQLASFGHSLRV
jgi:hypothetical protein